MKKYGKFAVLVVVIVGTLIWLATAGMKDTQTYYKTIAELNHMGDQAYVKRLLTCSGLRSKIVQAELRTEAGAPVPGLVIRAAKSVS